MARPIPFEAPPRDAKVELLHRLEQAPAEHAAALLDAYDLLQVLHEKKVLDTLRGLAGSGETVLDIAVQGAMAPESIRALRNMLLLFNLIGSIEPETMKQFTQPIPQAVQIAALPEKPPSLWHLVKCSLLDPDFRRGLSAMLSVTRAVGMGLSRRQK
jgi:uncharacterized protein YjgD (DUF1641 family)